MFDDVIAIASRTYHNADKAQLTISHAGMRDEVFIHLQDLSNLSGARIMDRFEKVLNSNQEMRVDESFKIDVGLMRLSKGGGKNSRSGRTLPLHPHLNNTMHSSIFNKKAIVEIVCTTDSNEFLCAAMSIVVCMAKLENMRRTNFLTLIRKCRQTGRGPNSLRSKALALQQKTDLPTTAPLRVDQLAAFEAVLNVKIVVIQFVDQSSEASITQCSNKTSPNIIFLYLTNEHFHAVVNPHAMFPKRKICMDCFETYPALSRTHPCAPSPCWICHRVECEYDKPIKCRDCNFKCKSQACYDTHKEPGTTAEGTSYCQEKTKCLNCGKTVFLKVQSFADHVCGQYQCKTCKDFVDMNHLCFLRRRSPKETSGKFLFFDFETMQDNIYQCESGYTPGPPNPTCTGCTSESQCSECRKCTNCKTPHCGRHVHQPNLVVCQSVCNACRTEPLTSESKCLSCGDLCKHCLRSKSALEELGEWACNDPLCGLREKIFKGYDTVHDFCSWLISPAHKHFTACAHNGKGYDFLFVLNYCVTEARIKPSCIYAGSKIMSLHIHDNLNIRFIDSLNFMGMALKKLPKAFGLTPETDLTGDISELQKGDFPHLMNTRANQNYVGPFPPLDMYCMGHLNAADKENFKQWHAAQTGKSFDLQAEMLAYCRLDVVILRLACMRFRQLFLDITTVTDVDGTVTGFVDPFAHVTIASACMQIYRVNFITEHYDLELSDLRSGPGTYKSGQWYLNDEPIDPCDIVSKAFLSSSLAQIPAQGYVRNSNHSSKSIAWLEWQSIKLGREIIHARNKGEKVLHCGTRRYLADGYDEQTNTVFEFHGCRYHGCTRCFPNRKVTDPRTGFTMDDLYNMTRRRSAAIRSAGYHLTEIFECEFDNQIQSDPDLAHFIKHDFDVPPRMQLRDAFYGGRTSCFTLYYECNEAEMEEIHYADVCSLYPYINKTAKMPVGHPTIITTDFDMSLKSYFGIAHVKLLPPKHEYVPCLPVRMHGKLTFPLCNACALSENQQNCDHSDSERAIVGVWCTPEIMAALAQGFTVLKIYEVYHYPNTAQYDPTTKTGGLFSEQVDLFMKIKAEASGYPDWVTTDTEKDRFIKQFHTKVGVLLDKDNISPNPALRSIAKICLNSFWGKLGERNNKLKTKFISSTVELEQLQHNSRHSLHRLHIVNEDTMVLEYNNKDEFEEDSFTTNEVIAAFTTCFARLELLRHIKSVGQNILYCDTDSIIFVTKRIENADGSTSYNPCPALGDSLGELTNELPAGCYITHFVTTAPKSYSYHCTDGAEVCKFKGLTLNFENSQRVNFTAVKELLFGTIDCITLAPQVQFKRSKYDGIIYNVDLTKSARATFNKRRITDNFDTVPFGYIISEELS